MPRGEIHQSNGRLALRSGADDGGLSGRVPRADQRHPQAGYLIAGEVGDASPGAG